MHSSEDPTVPGAPARRTGRTVAIVAGCAVGFLALLVAAAPTLVSMGLFRSTITGAVAGAVNGTVSVDSIDLGWFSGVAVRGFAIDDAPAGNSVRADLRLEQGLWALLTGGLRRLDVHLSGSATTRLEPDGTLAIAKLAKPAAAPAGTPPHAAAGTGGGILPAGLDVHLSLEGLAFEVRRPDGSPHVALRDLKGTLSLAAGGDASAKVTARTEVEGSSGSIEVDASAPGIVDAAGALRFAGTALALRVKATDAGFAAGGMPLRISSADIAAKAADLTGAIDAEVSLHAALDGSAPSTVTARVRVDRLLTAAGEPVVDLSGIHGSVRADALPTPPFQRFAEGHGLVLARDIGPTIDLEATFADAKGGAISLYLRGQSVSLRAEGSADPSTGAAHLRTVEADATLAPALLDAIGQLTVAAPAKLALRARDVVIPASSASGAFPADQLAFDGNMTLSLDGLRVPGPDGARVPLDVTSIRAALKAAPVAKGMDLDLSATASRGAAPLGAKGSLRLGGPFGAHGSLKVTSLPTALLRPFVPTSVPVDLARDVGDTVSSVTASVGEGDAPAVELLVDSPNVKVDFRGAVGADGAVRLERGSECTVLAMQPELLRALGVRADGAVGVAARFLRLDLPAPAHFDVARVALDVDLGVMPERNPPVHVIAGGGVDGRVIAVTAASATVRSAAIGEDVAVTLDATVDGLKPAVRVRAKGLGDCSMKSIESARLELSVDVPPFPSERIAREVPDAADALRNLESTMWSLAAKYSGSLREGTLDCSVSGDGPDDRVALRASLGKDALTVSGSASAKVSPLMLAHYAGTSAGRMVAPVKAGVEIAPVALRRSASWDFAAPADAKLQVSVGALALDGVPGVPGRAWISGTKLSAEIGLGDRMSARGTLDAELGASRSAAAPTRIAPLRAAFAWTAAHGKEPMSWSADAALDGISGDGLAALVDLDDSMRQEIGTGARIAARALSAKGGAISFELSSTLSRLKARLAGKLEGDVVSLADSSVEATIPAAQALSLLNAASASKDADGKPAPPAWKQVGAVDVKARIASLHMRLGSSAPAKDPPVAAAPAGAAGAATAPAAPSIRLPEGFAAQVALDVAPVRMVPASGDPLTLEGVAVTVAAPSLEAPATVKASLAITASGGARAPVTLDAKLTDWASGDGTVLLDRLRADGTLKAERASTRVVGALLGMGAELPEALGPDITVDAVVASSGPGVADGRATVASRFVNVQAPQVTLRSGVVSVVKEKPVVVDFVPSEPVRHRYLASINPVFRDIRLADEKKPIRFTVDSLSYPLDGNRARMSADMRMTVGEILMDRNPDNQLLNVLEIFQTSNGKPVEGTIDPLVVAVRDGQLRYKDFRVGIERQGKDWRTTLIFDGDIDLATSPPYARAIGANYPLGSVARSVVGVLPNEDGGGSVANVLSTLSLGVGQAVQLRISVRGPLGEVDGRPAKMQQKVKVVFDAKAMGKDVGKTVEEIGQAIGDLFNKGKKK